MMRSVAAYSLTPESMFASFLVLKPDSFWYSWQWMQGLDRELLGGGPMTRPFDPASFSVPLVSAASYHAQME